MLEAKVVMLEKQIAQMQAAIAPRGRGVHDEAVARGLVREFGGDWELVLAGKKDSRTCTARVCTVRTLIEQAGWTQRRTAEVLRVSEAAVWKSLRKLGVGSRTSATKRRAVSP